ncbi:hypothetical protein COW49_02430 [Candidatus Kaiserbacteria bacterium CG17_big_fil_post_rev_8_21_14_2_50_51_7]|uniref:Uncharacterized protein n=1 Tax=Candidatus Kaiserbacteria bacterium CG17_big_fil_post_rev_8_21_14_2_50_51_7 TaxID=1974613 RepID=A0A2M7FBW1_9BACT|nr:MAG: hypothetical protein COW49_02430 [Candidatus Kaiserbacteria bacterium CG17_big_fil_post_rev_8_21_14_2_50_51_7]
MNVTKVRYDGTRVHIEWTTGDPDKPDVYSLGCRQAPKQEFIKSLATLTPSVINICELPKDYIVGMTVCGVSFSKSRGAMGATITALKTLNDSDVPLVLTTPHIPLAPGSETWAALDEVLRQSELYVNGERAQGAMF